MNTMRIDTSYKALLVDVLELGEDIHTRNGVRRSLTSGYQIKVDLRTGFPLIGLRYIWFKGALVELLWMLQGSTSLDYLHKHGVHFWDKNAKGNNDLGPIYGKQWRDFGGIDQIEGLDLRLDQGDKGTRNLITAWNPAEQLQMALPPCHFSAQFNLGGECGLDLDTIVTMRSSDVMLGLPTNIAFYALFAHIMAKRHKYTARYLTMQLGHTHIYEPHINAAREMVLRRDTDMPTLEIDDNLSGDWGDIDWRNFNIYDYEHRGRISMEMIL